MLDKAQEIKPEAGTVPAVSPTEQKESPMRPLVPRPTPSRSGSIADMGNYSYMETHKTIQATSARDMDYTVRRSVRLTSVPAGIARSFSILFPDPSMQRMVDVDALSAMTTVAAVTQGMEGLEDPTYLLDRIHTIVEQSHVTARAIRAFPIKKFQAVEGGRTLIPAWNPNAGSSDQAVINASLSKYIIENGGKGTGQRSIIEEFVARWGNQMGALTDTVNVTGAVGRALQDMVLAHMLARLAPDFAVYFVDPRSVHYGSYKPTFIQAKVPWDDHTIGHMAAVRAQVIAQVEKELAALPDTEKFTHPRAKLLYALMMLTMQFDALKEHYGTKLYVYCGGFVPGPELRPLADSGTQELLNDMATCTATLEELRTVHTEVISMTFDDPNAPEPYYADLFGKVLKFAALMKDYTGTNLSRCAVGSLMTSTSASQRFTLSMEMHYWRQTYRTGSLTIGNVNSTLLIPTYGISGSSFMDRTITASSASGQVAIELGALVGDGIVLDPTDLHSIPFRTTEGPLEMCTLVERVLSPYIMSGLDTEALSIMSAAFQTALLVFGTRFSSMTYVGQGYVPYRGNFQNGQILKDTGMWEFDHAVQEYLDVLFADSGLEAQFKDYFKDCVYIPLGDETTRTGGLTLEYLLTFYCLTITNPPEEMTLTGPMVFIWSDQIAELIQYRVSTSLPRGRAPFSAR